MWHAPSFELVIRLILVHGCTVLNGIREWPSIRLVLGCIVVRREWQVQGSFEARGLTRPWSRLPNFGASNMMTIALARVKKSHWRFALVFSFSRLHNEIIIATLLHDLLSTLITNEYIIKLLFCQFLPIPYTSPSFFCTRILSSIA